MKITWTHKQFKVSFLVGLIQFGSIVRQYRTRWQGLMILLMHLHAHDNDVINVDHGRLRRYLQDLIGCLGYRPFRVLPQLLWWPVATYSKDPCKVAASQCKVVIKEKTMVCN
jgi:hypothetical protein